MALSFSQSRVLRIVLTYAIFAAAWVFFSDKAVDWLFQDAAIITLVSTIKGWLFVTVTSVLLYVLIRRLIDNPKEKGMPLPAGGLRWQLFLALMVPAIVSMTAISIGHTLKQGKEKEVARLRAIADLKAGQIADWMSERDRDVRFVETSRFFAETYHRWRGEGDPASGEILKNRLNQYREARSFQSLMLIDEHEEVLWSSEGTDEILSPPLKAAVRQMETQGRANLVGPYLDTKGRVRLDFVAPLLLTGNRSWPMVVLRVDPSVYLFETLQAWPGPINSGEMLLFSQDGDDVVFFNEHHHRNGAGRMMRVSMADKGILAGQVLREAVQAGSLVEGVDRWGVPVWGVARAVSGTNWFLLVKMDQAEAGSEPNRSALWIAVSGLFALFMVAAGSFLFRQQQQLTLVLHEREAQAEKLRELQLLDAIANNSSDAIYAKDRSGRYLFFNREAARLVGRSPWEVLGADDASIFPPEQAAAIMALDRKVMEEKGTVSVQQDLTTREGEVTFLATKGPLFDAAGNVVGCFGISHDITERKRAEQTLKESEERLRLALEGTSDGIWDWNPQTGKAYFSPRYYTMMGYEPDEFPASHESWRQRIHPDDLQRCEQIIGSATQAGSSFSVEFRFRAKDGQWRWILGRGKVVEFDRDGKAVRVTGSHTDITDRKQAEDRHTESERRLAQIIDFLPDATLVIDRDSRVIAWNRSMENMTGVKAEEMIGRGDYEYALPFYGERRPILIDLTLHPQPELEKEYTSLERRGDIFFGEAFTRHLKPGNRHLYASASVLRNSRGEIMGAIECIRDNTERKNLEERFQSLFSHMAEGVALHELVLDESGAPVNYRIVDHNAQYEKILRLRRQDVVGRLATEVYQTQEPPFLREFSAVALSGVPARIRNYFRPMERYFETSIAPWGNKGFATIFSDITEHKRAEEALRDSEAQFKAMFEMASIGMAQTNPRTGQWLRVNQKLCEITGYSSGELLGMRVPEITHPEDRERDWEAFQNVVAGKSRSYRMEKRYIRKDGAVVWVNVNVTVIRGPDGKPLRTMSTIEDITERKEIEEALAHSHDLMRYVIEYNRSAVAVHDRDLKYIYVSQRYLEEFKVKDPDVIGKHHYEVFPDLPQKWRDVHQRALAGEVCSADDDAYEREDGSVEWTRWECRPWFQSDGSIGGIIVYTEVITDRRRAQEERERLQAQLLQAQKMESVGRLAGGVAHDFNNMLGVILGHSELALTEIDSSQSAYLNLQEVLKAALRSADLVRQLLAFARKQTISPKVLNINETVESMLKMVRRLIGEDIELVWKPSVDIWPVKVDPTQIDQILANLCVNARDAIAGVGRIMIETGNVTVDEAYCREQAGAFPGHYVVLSLNDSGCGIDKETLSKIFEPFFTTKKVGKGTGLGLATVYGIVKQNNGFIEVHSEPGRGTAFRIYLPRTDIATDDEQPVGLQEKNLRGNETVLLVEDEASILAMGKTILERYGYTVLATQSPGEALRLAENHTGPLHLLITDVVMPIMNGKDLRQKLNAVIPGLKCIFISGYTADIIADHGILDEGIAFLQKPFSVETLAGKVREVLDG